MPSYLRGQKRDVITFVNINEVLLYGWAAPNLSAALGISDADLKNQLGHLSSTEALAVTNRIMVMGANSPKPARVTKKMASATASTKASTSTFCAYNKVGTALAPAAGWRLSKSASGVRLRASGAGRKSITAVATLSNGVLYAFPLNEADFAIASAPLGLDNSATVGSSNLKKLATGMTQTRPGKASKPDGLGTLTTFYSTPVKDTLGNSGWDIVDDERVQFPSPSAPVTP